MAKMTSWFPGDLKPVRPGVYMRKMPWGGYGYSQWDGSRWYVCAENVAAATCVTKVSATQDAPWKGLAEEPK